MFPMPGTIFAALSAISRSFNISAWRNDGGEELRDDLKLGDDKVLILGDIFLGEDMVLLLEDNIDNEKGRMRKL
ncbi:hypothetical protein C8J56DRAFT_992383 [Mycena floridula]|nr:hypothetical protein C8J56DRAFT_992383 [Mycena floridula]